MNKNHAALPEADLSPADPVGDRAAPSFGPKDSRDPGCAGRHAAILERMADIGVTLAEELPALARAQARLAGAVTERLRTTRPEGMAALGELAVTLHQGNVDFAQMYERICRSVRRCIAMQIQGVPALRARAGARDAAPRPSAAGKPAAGARDRSGAKNDNAAELANELGAERLFSDLYDRPEDPTGMADLGLDRPLNELVAEICADFGVDGRIWADRLGIGEVAAASTGNSHSGRGRSDPDKRRGDRPPDIAPSAPAGRRNRHPPDIPVTDDPGHSADIRLGGRNRRERRAAAKLARRPAASANSRPHESGRPP